MSVILDAMIMACHKNAMKGKTSKIRLERHLGRKQEIER